MEYSNLIKSRYSVRAFSRQQVEQEKLDAILEAGRIAPTAGNRQPQRIVVVRSEEGLRKMNECTPCLYNASIMLLVCYDKREQNLNFTGDQRGYGMIDGAIVMTQMMLKTFDLGLGCVWVGLFSPEKLIKAFNIPDEYEIVGLMPIGYPAKNSAPGEKHSIRLPIGKTVYYEHF